ncbi:MAG: hypothetical protein IJC21_03160 [Lentisphaeria bacterium]|nr:hypothetical protein [Lentisphaeria bacterium]
MSQEKCFAPEQRRECTTVHDRSSAAARHEIDHNAPTPEIFLHNKWNNNFFEKSLAFLTNISYSLQMTNCIVALKIEKELQNGKR